MEEIWVDIEGYEGLYQVSNQGRVRSLDREVIRNNGIKQKINGCILTPYKNDDGYLCINLYNKGKRKEYKIHRLVAINFVEGWFEGAEVDHIDTDRQNNAWTNLKWVTHKDNCNNETTKENYRKSKIGKKLSKEEIEKLRISRLGCKHTEETKQKISDNKKGKYIGKDNHGSKKVVQLTLDKKIIKIWDCMTDANRERGFNINCISRCCKKKNKSHKGFIWLYYEDYINNNY